MYAEKEVEEVEKKSDLYFFFIVWGQIERDPEYFLCCDRPVSAIAVVPSSLPLPSHSYSWHSSLLNTSSQLGIDIRYSMCIFFAVLTTNL